jgi:methyltransferase (TIGR00027 family)
MKEDSASSTAFTVLQGLLLSADSPAYGPLVSAETRAAGRHILSATPQGQKRLKQLASPVFRTLAPIAEKLLMPGISKHYVIRKTFFEKAARQAIADGYQQVINLGAGFDVLAWTLHTQAPQVTFIEIDHPATSAVKQQAVGNDGGANLHLLAVDLAENSLAAALGGFEPFRADVPTLFICEGVLMYLPLSAVQGLFAAIKDLTGARSRLAFTAVSPIGSSNNNTGWLLRTYLSLKSEPLAWTLEQSDLAAFVGAQGYALLDHGDTAALLARYLPQGAPGPHHRGEFMALAEAVG